MTICRRGRVRDGQRKRKCGMEKERERRGSDREENKKETF